MSTEEPPMIVIRKIDLPPEKPKSERELEIEKVSEEAVADEKLRLEQSTNMSEFLTWHRAILWSSPKFIGWMWDKEGGPSASVIVDDFASKKTSFEKEARVVEEMSQKLAQMEDKTDMAKVTLKRVRDSGGEYFYRAMAEYPKGIKIQDDVLGNSPYEDKQLIYFEPENACVRHACDVLYRLHRDTGSSFYIPLIDAEQAKIKLKEDGNGVYEFVLKKDETGVETQEVEPYLIVGLRGGYGNEILRTRVSDFRQKTGSASM